MFLNLIFVWFVQITPDYSQQNAIGESNKKKSKVLKFTFLAIILLSSSLIFKWLKKNFLCLVRSTQATWPLEKWQRFRYGTTSFWLWCCLYQQVSDYTIGLQVANKKQQRYSFIYSNLIRFYNNSFHFLFTIGIFSGG